MGRGSALPGIGDVEASLRAQSNPPSVFPPKLRSGDQLRVIAPSRSIGIIGDETRAQCLELVGRLPDAALACVGGGSNAIGMFSGFVDDESVRL